jgi:predicted esterase
MLAYQRIVPSAAASLVALALLTAGCRPEPATQPAPQPPEPSKAPVHLIAYDEAGAIQEADAKRLDEIITKAKAKPPTHIFIAAHGWLNAPDTAQGSYDQMRDLLFNVAVDQKLYPKGYEPLRIGVYWPSMKLEKTQQELSSGSEKGAAKALGGVSKDDAPAADPGRSEKFRADVNKLRELVKRNAAKGAADFKKDLEQANEIFRAHAPAGAIAPFDPADLPDLDVDTIERASQLYTYWQMKQRAGIEGEKGVNALVARLQKEFPKATVHLIGHSFGCKVVLSALAKDLPRPVDTVVLLQGAISYQAFADKVVGLRPDTEGGYRKVLPRVNGPVVATFSTKDHAVGVDYPIASHLARQVGEVDGKAAVPGTRKESYGGLGGVAASGKDPVAMVKKGTKYGFERGLYSIDASEYVPGHSDIYNEDVAWLIWAAVLRR